MDSSSPERRPLFPGRTFLVGDAAHRVPPSGATGVSFAVADAHKSREALGREARHAGEALALDLLTDSRRGVQARLTVGATNSWERACERRESTTQAPTSARARDGRASLFGELPRFTVDDSSRYVIVWCSVFTEHQTPGRLVR